jgi:hypothetical protein
VLLGLSSCAPCVSEFNNRADGKSNGDGNAESNGDVWALGGLQDEWSSHGAPRRPAWKKYLHRIHWCLLDDRHRMGYLQRKQARPFSLALFMTAGQG